MNTWLVTLNWESRWLPEQYRDPNMVTALLNELSDYSPIVLYGQDNNDVIGGLGLGIEAEDGPNALAIALYLTHRVMKKLWLPEPAETKTNVIERGAAYQLLDTLARFREIIEGLSLDFPPSAN